ncbi:MAG: hypothetical protein N3F03_06730 [Ignavibacteria bacterium]|nr:hypothetical protein [Ignavibacteria bacterium]
MQTNDPYSRNLINKNFYHSKKELTGKFVVVLDGYLENRGLKIIQQPSRAFSKHTIIELIGSDEENIQPGSTVDKIAYIGFVELFDSGVLLIGDKIICNEKEIGVIVGFDDTHMPNHQNVIVYQTKRISGKELGIKIDDKILIPGF